VVKLGDGSGFSSDAAPSVAVIVAAGAAALRRSRSARLCRMLVTTRVGACSLVASAHELGDG
jgi:hypothetical protein